MKVSKLIKVLKRLNKDYEVIIAHGRIWEIDSRYDTVYKDCYGNQFVIRIYKDNKTVIISR